MAYDVDDGTGIYIIIITCVCVRLLFEIPREEKILLHLLLLLCFFFFSLLIGRSYDTINPIQSNPRTVLNPAYKALLT